MITKFLIGLIALIIGFTGGYFVGGVQTDRIISNLEEYNFVTPIFDNSPFFEGSIQSFTENTITIKEPPTIRSIVRGEDGGRTVKIDETTEIVKLTDDENREVIETTISLSELVVGDEVVVVLAQSVSGETSDVAERIILDERVALPQEEPPIVE